MRTVLMQFSLIMASWLVAYLFADQKVSTRFWILWVLGTIVAELAMYAFLKRMHKLQRKECERFREEMAIPFEDAKQRALEKMLRARAVPRSTALSDAETRGMIPPAVQELFGMYESIASGGIELSALMIGDSAYRPGFTKIGGGNDGTEIVVVSSTDERVWEVEGGDPEEEFQAGGYPSIWHYLVMNLE